VLYHPPKCLEGFPKEFGSRLQTVVTTGAPVQLDGVWQTVRVVSGGYRLMLLPPIIYNKQSMSSIQYKCVSSNKNMPLFEKKLCCMAETFNSNEPIHFWPYCAATFRPNLSSTLTFSLSAALKASVHQPP